MGEVTGRIEQSYTLQKNKHLARPAILIAILSAVSIICFFMKWFEARHTCYDPLSLIDFFRLLKSSSEEGDVVAAYLIVIGVVVCTLFYAIGIIRIFMYDEDKAYVITGVSCLFSMLFAITIFIATFVQGDSFLPSAWYYLFSAVSVANCYASWKMALSVGDAT